MRQCRWCGGCGPDKEFVSDGSGIYEHNSYLRCISALRDRIATTEARLEKLEPKQPEKSLAEIAYEAAFPGAIWGNVTVGGREAWRYGVAAAIAEYERRRGVVT